MAGKRPLDGGHEDPVSGSSKRANLEPDDEGERPGFGSTSASFIKASTKFINFKKSGGGDGYLPKDDRYTHKFAVHWHYMFLQK